MVDEELTEPPELPSSELIWIGGGIDEVSVTLRFFGDDLDPQLLSNSLKCHPTDSHRKGDLLASKRYRRIATTGMWLFKISKDEEGYLEEKISRLLDSVSEDLEVWRELKRFRHDVFCFLSLKAWNRGCSLTPELMRRLADRDLELGLDIYSADPEDVSQL